MALRLIAAIVPFDSCGMQSYNKKNVIRNIKKEGLCFSLKDNTTKFCISTCFHRENYCACEKKQHENLFWLLRKLEVI